MEDQTNALIPACTTIFYLNEMNTMMVEENGSILIAFKRNHLPEFLLPIQQKDFSFLWMEARQHANSCCLYTNVLGISYLASLWRTEEGENRLLVNGPFLKQTPDTNKLKTIIPMDQKRQIIVEEYIRGLKLVGSSKIRSMAAILRNVGTLYPVTLHSIDAQQTSLDTRKLSNLKKSFQQPDEKYMDLIELRYKLENEMMQAVGHGDKQKVQESFLRFNELFDFSERLPSQPVRMMKNGLIILNTLLRVAAEKHG